MAVWTIPNRLDPSSPPKLPKRGSVAYNILLFIGQNRGVTTTQVQRHLVENLLKKTWDSKKRAGLWNSTLYGVNREGLFPKYCVKFDKLWYLTEESAAALTKDAGVPLIHRRAIATLADQNITARDLSVENAERLPNLPEPPKHELVRLHDELRIARKKAATAAKIANDANIALCTADADVERIAARLKEILELE
jgi:hypothetical protein